MEDEKEEKLTPGFVQTETGAAENWAAAICSAAHGNRTYWLHAWASQRLEGPCTECPSRTGLCASSVFPHSSAIYFAIIDFVIKHIQSKQKALLEWVMIHPTSQQRWLLCALLLHRFRHPLTRSQGNELTAQFASHNFTFPEIKEIGRRSFRRLTMYLSAHLSVKMPNSTRHWTMRSRLMLLVLATSLSMLRLMTCLSSSSIPNWKDAMVAV